MKKLLTLSLLTMILALLSSCGKNTWMIKRHYTSGYYVSHNKGMKNVAPNEVARNSTKVQQQRVYVQSDPELDQSANAAIEQAQEPTACAPIVKSRPGKRAIPKKNVSESRIKTYSLNVKHVSSALKEMKAKAASSDSDRALSWVWIIIVVVLILWAIGFLAGGLGLGNFINLLLLIALILLILWLLRIV